MTIEKICSKLSITEGGITAACDSMEAIIMTIDKDTSFSSKSNHFNMLSVIDAKLEPSKIQWNWHHVKGHHNDQVGPI